VVTNRFLYHLRVPPDQIGEYVLLPGDPARVSIIADRLTDPRQIGNNREFVSFSGLLERHTVTVTSTGIGGPSAAIAVEELARAGAATFLRVGTAGSLDNNLRVGDLLAISAAIQDDGTSRAYIPDGRCIQSDPVVQTCLLLAMSGTSVERAGIVQTVDAFYGPDPAVRDSSLPGPHVVDMECAAIMAVARARGKRAGALLKVVNRLGEAIDPIDADPVNLAELIDCAIEGLRCLIAKDYPDGSNH
jgi:uridine phosphorylase